MSTLIESIYPPKASPNIGKCLKKFWKKIKKIISGVFSIFLYRDPVEEAIDFERRKHNYSRFWY